MPRDASGNYTLPAGNPVTSGTTITSIWANATMPDIGNAITDSLSRSGQGGMLVPLRVGDGTNIQPAFSFTNEISLGMYRVGTGVMGFATGSVLQATISSGLTGAQDVFTNAKLAGYNGSGLAANFIGDLDTIVKNSQYVIFGGNVTNLPSDFNAGGLGFVETRADTANTTQIIYGDLANENKIWMRNLAAAVWSAWKLVVDGGGFTSRLAGYLDTGLHVNFTGDLDTILVNSVYAADADVVTNNPPDADSWGIVITDMGTTATFGTQTFIGIVSNLDLFKHWQRILSGGVWGAWKLVVNGGAFTLRLPGMNDTGTTQNSINDAGLDPDLDLILQNSNYVVTDVNTNLPPSWATGEVGWLWTAIAGGSGNAVQIIQSRLVSTDNNDSPSTYQRTRVLNVWGAWYKTGDGEANPPANLIVLDLFKIRGADWSGLSAITSGTALKSPDLVTMFTRKSASKKVILTFTGHSSINTGSQVNVMEFRRDDVLLKAQNSTQVSVGNLQQALFAVFEDAACPVGVAVEYSMYAYVSADIGEWKGSAGSNCVFTIEEK